MAAGRGRAVRALAVTIALLTAAACTGGDGDDPATASTAPGDPIEGGTVRLGLGGPLVVDPVQASLASPSDLMVLDLLYDGLTRVDGDGVAQPALAAEWESNGDATAFRFTLDPEATFASGRAITPTDVIASLERVLEAGDTSLVALSLEAVSGFRAFVDGEAEHVSGLTAPDAETVRVGLDKPLSVLPVVLSNPLLAVVDADTVADDDLGALDLSGAWAVASAADDGLRVERRAGTAGSLDAVELRPYDDAEAAYDAFDDGDVDWATVPPARFEQAARDHDDDHFAPFHAELYFGMNLSSPNLGNAVLRQAILAAIDREAIVEAVYPDLADPLSTVVPAGVTGHDAGRCGERCTFDPEGAAAKVRIAFPDGTVPVVKIDFDESVAQQAMAELIAGDLDDVGIPTELRPLPLEDYKRFVVSGGQELFSFGWIGAYASPDAYLAPLFGSAADDNLTDYRSTEVDGFLDRARGATDAAANAERWGSAEARILDAAVVVPIAQFRTQVVVADRVQGLVHAVDGTVDWAEVQVTD
jgi:ABC-type transport system substrate-binding protein